MKLEKPEQYDAVIIPFDSLDESDYCKQTLPVQKPPSEIQNARQQYLEPFMFFLPEFDIIQMHAQSISCRLSDMRLCVEATYDYDEGIGSMEVYVAYVGPEPLANFAKRVKIYEEKLAAQADKPSVDRTKAKAEKKLKEIAKLEAELAKLKSSL